MAGGALQYGLTTDRCIAFHGRMATTLASFLETAWGRHDKEPEKVLAEGRALIGSAGDGTLVPLGRLLFHVAAEHLGRFGDAAAVLAELRGRPSCLPGSPEERTLWRFASAAHVCAGETALAQDAEAHASAGNLRPPESERGAIHALAAAAFLGQKRAAEASAHFEKALYCAHYGPEKDDPLSRALAVTGNNLACELEVRPSRSPEEDRLMLTAAEAARRYWEVAGNWSHVEGAEYRLAMTCVALKQGGRALEHARAALALCDANEADATTRFFAHDAEARALHTAGEREPARAARAKLAALLAKVPEGDREYCAGELAKLDSFLAA